MAGPTEHTQKIYEVVTIDELTVPDPVRGLATVYRHTILIAGKVRRRIDIAEADFEPDKVAKILAREADKVIKILAL